MTSTELDGLRSELRQLRQRFSVELPEQLRDARTYGDNSNNDEYHAVREEEMVLKARIRLLENAVARAVVVDPDQEAPGVAAIGATVEIKGLNLRDKSHRYRIVSAHAIDGDVITAASPVGQAIMGAEPGTVVTVDLPGGRSRKVRLTAVGAGDADGDRAGVAEDASRRPETSERRSLIARTPRGAVPNSRA